jgi:ADP-ribose pyrophosphatase YjhB (NUDIX family)
MPKEQSMWLVFSKYWKRLTEKRHKVYVAASLLVSNNEKILLQLRRNTGYMDGFYDLPGGHLEAGEFFSDACRREVLEEAGIELLPKNIKPLHIVMDCSKHDKQNAYVSVCFGVKNYHGKIKNREPNKCTELKWFDTINLPSNIAPKAKFILEKISNGQFYSEYISIPQ